MCGARPVKTGGRTIDTEGAKCKIPRLMRRVHAACLRSGERVAKQRGAVISGWTKIGTHQTTPAAALNIVREATQRKRAEHDVSTPGELLGIPDLGCELAPCPPSTTFLSSWGH